MREYVVDVWSGTGDKLGREKGRGDDITVRKILDIAASYNIEVFLARDADGLILFSGDTQGLRLVSGKVNSLTDDKGYVSIEDVGLETKK